MASKAKRNAKTRGGVGASRKTTNDLGKRGSKHVPEREETRRHGAHALAGSKRQDTRRKNVASTADRNVKNDKNHATHELEGVAPSKRPTRKSTRGAANRAKPDSQLRRRATRRTRSPESRHGMRAG